MTKEDARKVVFEKMKNLEGRECQGFVDAIEALGLIKFDDVEKIWCESKYNHKWGIIQVSEYEGRLYLSVGGRRKYVLEEKDV